MTKEELEKELIVEYIPHIPKIKYIAEDGNEFYDKEEYRKHCTELHLRKMEIIYRESVFDKMGSWWFLLVFIVGYAFGFLCGFIN